jgi:hypothetical protein
MSSSSRRPWERKAISLPKDFGSNKALVYDKIPAYRLSREHVLDYFATEFPEQEDFKLEVSAQ